MNIVATLIVITIMNGVPVHTSNLDTTSLAQCISNLHMIKEVNNVYRESNTGMWFNASCNARLAEVEGEDE